jgi:hypothetical protein
MKRILLLIIILLLIMCCSKNGDEKIAEIGIDSLSIETFSMPISICASENYLFVSDIINRTIYKIEGRKIINEYHSTGGKGPGEFLNPSEIVCYKNKLYLMDRALMRVSIFTDDFKYLSSFLLDNQPNSIAVSSDNIYVNYLMAKKGIAKYSCDGKLVDSFCISNIINYTDMLNNAMEMIYDENQKNLICGFTTTNKIIKFDNDGKIINTLEYNVDIPKINGKFSEKKGIWELNPGTIFCSDIALYNGKIILLSGGGFTGRQEQRIPIKNMEYFLIIIENNNIRHYKLNLPKEDAVGYKFAILKDDIYFISPSHNKIYFTSLRKIDEI